MLYLEIHDNDPNPSTLLGTTRAEYSYQIEQWVIDTAAEKPAAVRWVAYNDDGQPIRQWERAHAGVDFAEVPVTPGTEIHPITLRRLREDR